MRMLFRYSIALLFVVAHSLANAQALWSGTEVGMSIDQVKSIVPQAVAPASPSRLATGAQELLRLDEVEIVNKKFAASFYFIDGKLTQVTLSLEKGYSFDSATLVFNSLTEVLRSKYGPEINRENSRGLLNRRSATWISGRTNISVLAMSVGSNDALLNINYQSRVARDADKL